MIPLASAQAATTINTKQTSYSSANLGSSVDPIFQGGTLQIAGAGTITQDFDVQDYDTNTIDANGKAVTFSGALTGAGGLIFKDGVGGGVVTLTSSTNAYTGVTTINSGATVALSGTGTLISSSQVAVNGTLDISGTTSGATLKSLAGAGNVTLGAQTLSIGGASTTFSGVISGTGGFKLLGGTQTLSGANTYTGGT
ncbi:MAG TPA: hypothetical protein VHL34_01920, partial [Rhizomicrobium sp.]|nr:hypothetical protein [Rhizomicrobium sp.]